MPEETPQTGSDMQILNWIGGRIVLAGTDVGVPNLVVVALDFDSGSISSLLGAREDEERQRAAIAEFRKSGDIRAYLTMLSENPLLEKLFPQRLGSVITSSDGSFSIEYQDDLFFDGNVEQNVPNTDFRPDLVVLVLGPDRPNESGQGLSIVERLLFYTQPIQFESGRTENFIIELDAARLEKFGVSTASFDFTSNKTVSSPEGLRIKSENNYKRNLTNIEISDELFLKYEEPALTRTQTGISKLLPNILPRNYGSNKNFFGFLPKPEEVLLQNWKHWKLLPWLLAGNPSGAVKTGRVYLTDKDIKKLALDATALRKPAGTTVAFEALLSQIGYPSGPYRNRNLFSQIDVLRTLASLKSKANSTRNDRTDPPVTAITTVDSLREDVLNRLNEQLAGLSRPLDQANPASDLSRIKAVIEKLEQNSGAAGVAASHDIDLLQIAFEPVWTAIFDEDLKKEAQKLYGEVVKTPGASLNILLEPISTVTTVTEFRDWLGIVHTISQTTSHPNIKEMGGRAASLAKRLSEPYSFKYFPAGSVNFGIVQTYRQSWTPLTYQAGRLAETLPLAPGESRTIKISRTTRSRFKRNSREKTNQSRTSETNTVSRTEIDAIEKVAVAMSAQISAQAQGNVGIASLSGTSQFGASQSQESQRVQKTFAEMTRKASQEVRSEVEIQVEEEVSSEFASESTRVIRNPNDEITVTYLLYELERRFRVSSRLQAVQPCILVALDMPSPSDINEPWLLEHAWILKDALLDDEFEESFNTLENRRTRENAELEVLKSNLDAATSVQKNAKAEFERLSLLAKSRRQSIVGLMESASTVAAGQDSTTTRVAKAFFTGGLSEVYGGGQTNKDEILRGQQEAAQKALEYIQAEMSAAAEALDKSNAVLNSATDKYTAAILTKALADQKIAQLRLHIKGNIFHYMHAIWSRRDPDDLFYSLFDLEIPFIETKPTQCHVRPPTPDELDDEVPGVVIDGELFMVDITPATAVPELKDVPKRKLIEVADIDHPIGFKGNYILLPLKKGSLLTDYMTVGYLDGYFGVRDSATDSSYSANDLVELAESIWNDPVIALTETQKEKLAKLITRASLRNPGYDTEIVLPTGQVFMEALKGDQALLEDFKLAHRGMDVLKVEEEVRRERIENLRRIQRVGLKEPALEDPDIEKTTLVKGISSSLSISPDG
jgi:hypothetical protein